jgi:hypothetical protein
MLLSVIYIGLIEHLTMVSGLVPVLTSSTGVQMGAVST